MASIRLQLIPSINAARSRNFDTEVWSLHCNKIESKILNNKPFGCIVGKLATHADLQANMYIANSSILSRFKDIGTPIISIYSDNHARRSDLTGSLYRQILNTSSIVVCPTKTLQKAVLNFNPKAHTCVIEDPWQVKEMKEIKTHLDEFIKLIWFGSPPNWKYMKNMLTKLWSHLEPSKKYVLTILTSEKAISAIKKDLINSTPPQNIKIKIVRWSNFDQPNQLQKLLAESDLALVPSDPNDSAKQGVSHNRVVDAARAGCITIASPIPSYKEIESIAIISDNIPQSLNKAVKNYKAYSEKISLSRKAALQRFSPSENAKKWGEIIDEIAGSSFN